LKNIFDDYGLMLNSPIYMKYYGIYDLAGISFYQFLFSRYY